MAPTDLTPPALIGESAAFQDALDHVSAAAPLDRPVLVVGERGAGKELIAERLHFLSTRWDSAFLKVNCAALTEDLLESELFGHEAGAFTGATKRHRGRFERADGGTLFLDEIGVSSARMQEKILRVIEYGEFERLGGEATQRVNVRVIGATNEDLPGKAETGAFRADLLDRLAFDVITAPPLRARNRDIALLAAHFASKMARELGHVQFPGFTAEAMRELTAYSWPGNVRELRNVAERAVYKHFARGGADDDPIAQIELDPFASPYRPKTPKQAEASPASPARHGPPTSLDATPPRAAYDFKAQIDAVEAEWLNAALRANRGRQTDTADYLGLTYDQLRGLLKKHRLLPARKRDATQPLAK